MEDVEEVEAPANWRAIVGAGVVGLLWGSVVQWVLPLQAYLVTVTLLCLLVGVRNLRPPYLIQDEVTAFGLCFGLVRPWSLLQSGLLGLAIGLVLFTLLERTGQMGRGCTKWASVLGLLLGWQIAPLAFFGAFMLGALVAIPLLMLGQNSRAPIPFGVFLAASGILAGYWGPQFLLWLNEF